MLNLQELKKNALFAGIEVSELRRFLPRLEKKYYSRRDLVFKEGDPSQAIYLILSGQIKIIGRDAYGRHAVLMYLHAGDFFGETSMITGQTRSVTAEVVIDADLLIMEMDIFEEISREEPRILHNLLRTLNQRISSKTKGLVQQSPKPHTVVSIYHSRKEMDGAFLTANLAASILKQTGSKVAVLDLSFKDDNFIKILRLNPDKEIKQHEITREFIEKMLIPHSSGLQFLVLSPASLREGKIGREKIALILSILKEKFSYTLINTASEITNNTFEALDLSDKIILITHLGEEPPVGMFNHQEIVVVYYQTPDQFLPPEVSLKLTTPLIIDWEPQQLKQFHKTGELIGEFDSENPVVQSLHRLARYVTELRLGIAFGGVAARGLAHIGILEVLEQNQIAIDILAGTNTGAIIGAAYASGVRSKDLSSIVSKLVSESNLTTFADFKIFQRRLLTKKILKSISSFIDPSTTFSQLKIPLRVIAMELETGKEIVFDKGHLLDALLVSLAIPGVSPPVQLNGKSLVDGSVKNPIPVSHLLEMGADIVVGVNALSPFGKHPFISSFDADKNKAGGVSNENWKMLDIIMGSFQRLQHEVSLSKTTPADLVITPEVTRFSWKSLKDTSEIIDAGRRAAEQALPKLLEIRNKRKLYKR